MNPFQWVDGKNEGELKNATTGKIGALAFTTGAF
jgi:hypothetical protein